MYQVRLPATRRREPRVWGNRYRFTVVDREARLMSYLLVIIGGAMALTPGILDPYNVPVNGLTLLGVLVMAAGAVLAVRGR